MMLFALPWSSLVWVGVFVVVVICIHRALSGMVRRTNAMKDARGRLPVVIDEKNPQRGLETTALSDGEYAGHAYEARLHSGEGVRPPFLFVSLFTSSACCFTVVRHRPSEVPRNLLARITMKRVLTGDQSFDDDFRVDAFGATAPLEPCFQSPEVQAAVRRLFDLGYTYVRSDGKGFDAAWTLYAGPQPAEPVLVKETLSALNDLASQCPATIPATAAATKSSWGNSKATLAMLAVGLVWVILVAFFRVHYQSVEPDHQGMRTMLLGGLALGAVLAFAVIWRFRRTRSILFLVVFSLLAASIGPVCVGVVRSILNVHLDRGPESRHVQRVVGWGWENRLVPSHFVDVRHWLRGAEPQRVFISKQVYEEIAKAEESSEGAGVYMEVNTRPGRLGSPWISSYRLIEAPAVDEPRTK